METNDKAKTVDVPQGANALVGTKQVAKILGISTKVFERWHAAGKFVEPEFPMDLCRRRLWRLKTINRWIDEQCEKGNAR